MSHIHIPDGVLPIWLILAGWALTGAFIVLCVFRLRNEESARKLPLLGALSALMVVAMTIEVVPIAYHVNLVVLAGIILGPALLFIASFIVNLILALFGHGGVTVIGLNTLVIGAEGLFGFLLFNGLVKLTSGRVGPGFTAGVGTVLSLFLSTVLMIGIVGVSNAGPVHQTPEVEPDGSTPGVLGRLARGVLAFELLSGSEGEEGHADERSVDVATFAKLVLGLGSIGWLIEGVLTGLIVSYIRRIRPDIIALGR